jgi:hypothetical protein
MHLLHRRSPFSFTRIHAKLRSSQVWQGILLADVCMDSMEGVYGLNGSTIDRGLEVPLIDRLGAHCALET